MNRRSFLAALGVAPVFAAGAVKLAASKPDMGEAAFRMKPGYTPGDGWAAQIGIEVKAGEGSALRSAGLYLDANAFGQSRVIIDAERFVIGQGRPDNLVELIQVV